MTDTWVLYGVGFGLLFAGILALIAAIILIAAKQARNTKTKTAGIIIIGPVPIIFGSDKKTVKTLLTLSVALTAVLVMAMVLYYLLFR
jgi:uncharacterized protein (TIGR00304 family)